MKHWKENFVTFYHMQKTKQKKNKKTKTKKKKKKKKPTITNKQDQKQKLIWTYAQFCLVSPEYLTFISTNG